MINFNIDLEKLALFKDDAYLGIFILIAFFVEYYFRKTKKNWYNGKKCVAGMS